MDSLLHGIMHFIAATHKGFVTNHVFDRWTAFSMVLCTSLLQRIKMRKLCCLNQHDPHFSAFQAFSSLVVCWLLWKEPVCWWWWECRLGRGQSYCRCSKW